MKIRSLMTAMLIAAISFFPVQAKSKSGSSGHSAGKSTHRSRSKSSKHTSHKPQTSKPKSS
ncbi:MAG TPA: hypothetical protein VNY30_25440 [Bryobacteraceae bacterium]|jgi:hypothetical protein|nr:hypothetical protein [Bryobacteraceae bacterium]